MKIPAIPTTYKGIRFRSRLEARWAAFFDLCGWVWEYEPIDLAGYIPDFLIYRQPDLRQPGGGWAPTVVRDRPVLVEVKPTTERDRATQRKIVRAITGYSGQGAPFGGCLLLGNGPMDGPSKWFLSVGWLLSPHWAKDLANGRTLEEALGTYHGCEVWHLASLMFRLDAGAGMVEHQDTDLCTGDRLHLSDIDEGSREMATAHWREAGNAVQYKGDLALVGGR